jgi:hypothetical protein
MYSLSLLYCEYNMHCKWLRYMHKLIKSSPKMYSYVLSGLFFLTSLKKSDCISDSYRIVVLLYHLLEFNVKLLWLAYMYTFSQGKLVPLEPNCRYNRQSPIGILYLSLRSVTVLWLIDWFYCINDENKFTTIRNPEGKMVVRGCWYSDV